MSDLLPPVAVIGAGAMGAGIAQVAAQAGRKVLLLDARDGAAATAIGAIGAALARLVEKGRLGAAARAAALDRLVAVTAIEDVGQAALVIEAIVEDLEAKRGLFRRLEAIVPAEAILATNTSSLSVTSIASVLARPERVVGMHFFNPAPLMALVEIVSGLATSRAVAEVAFATTMAWGKTPVHAMSTPGFIVNRCARPFYAEALRLLEERAADVATIDAIVREAGGFRMGPFELMDLVGHDVNFAVTSSVWNATFHDSRYRPSVIQRDLVESGRLGRKTGRGFYDHAPGAARPEPATAAAASRPARIVVAGDLGPAAALADLARQAGIAVERAPGDGWIGIDDTRARPGDGRSATRRAAELGQPNTVVFDLALDHAKASRIALAVADQAPPGAALPVIGLFQALGKAVSIIDDVPGLVVTRLAATLANEAADGVHRGVATAEDIDAAMMLGVNYPIGPLTWARRVGLARTVTVLDHLAESYGEDRYRVSPWLRRKAEERNVEAP